MSRQSDLTYHWFHEPVDETWKDGAVCADEDPVLWFPNEEGQRLYDRAVRALTTQARAICNRCPVQKNCLEYAIKTDARHGMWGGLTEHERAKLTRKRSS
jgi:WhiB family transcriptional regulator, redox-sensing transcriptional regulator